MYPRDWGVSPHGKEPKRGHSLTYPRLTMRRTDMELLG